LIQKDDEWAELTLEQKIDKLKKAVLERIPEIGFILFLLT
jgi:hypothetical protein